MNQNPRDYTVRSSAVLTNSYVAGTVIGIDQWLATDYNQCILYVDFTIGSLTTAEVKIEYSNDGTNYNQETFSSVSGANSAETAGVYQYSATGNYVISVPIKGRYIKVSVKGTGTVTNSLMAIRALLLSN